MAATPSPPSISNSTAADADRDLIKQIRSHEVTIAELNNLSSSRAVYQRNGNIFFCTPAQRALASEQRQLDLAKAKLK